MDISFDPVKRAKTLGERKIDFADADQVFAGETVTISSPQDHGEERFITSGFLGGRFVVVVWTSRQGSRRILSMRHGHDKERDRVFDSLGRPR